MPVLLGCVPSDQLKRRHTMIQAKTNKEKTRLLAHASERVPLRNDNEFVPYFQRGNRDLKEALLSEMKGVW